MNALHHQSVDRLGRGLKVVAKDESGIVQATESEGPAFSSAYSGIRNCCSGNRNSNGFLPRWQMPHARRRPRSTATVLAFEELGRAPHLARKERDDLAFLRQTAIVVGWPRGDPC